MAYYRRFRSYYRKPFRRFKPYFSRFRSYGRKKFSSFRGKYRSYTKGRKVGVLWGVIFALILIPLLVYLYQNRVQIMALLQGKKTPGSTKIAE